MLRRDLLIGGAAASLAAPAWASAPTLRDAAREAFIYTLPMVEVARVRTRILGAGLPPGRFFPQRALANPVAYADYAVGFEGDPVWTAAHDHHLTALVEIHTTGQPPAVIFQSRPPPGLIQPAAPATAK